MWKTRMRLEAEVWGLRGQGVSNSPTAVILTSGLAGPESADQLTRSGDEGGGVGGDYSDAFQEGCKESRWVAPRPPPQTQVATLSGHRAEIHDNCDGRAWRVQPGGLSLHVLHLHRGAPAHCPQVGSLAGRAVGAWQGRGTQALRAVRVAEHLVTGTR